MKTRGTRKQQAAVLLATLREGPSIDTDDETLARFQGWLNSWVIPAVKRLIPELKEHNDGRVG